MSGDLFDIPGFHGENLLAASPAKPKKGSSGGAGLALFADAPDPAPSAPTRNMFDDVPEPDAGDASTLADFGGGRRVSNHADFEEEALMRVAQLQRKPLMPVGLTGSMFKTDDVIGAANRPKSARPPPAVAAALPVIQDPTRWDPSAQDGQGRSMGDLPQNLFGAPAPPPKRRRHHHHRTKHTDSKKGT
jgi:hypothetical protein